ncbi:MAG: type IX secretion system protein PorQ [Flavobacteriales bacterium]
MIRLILFILLLSSVPVVAQLGGQTTYGFLNLSGSARVEAMGGNLITVKDNDAGLALHNPALLNKEMVSFTSLSFMNYFAGINYGYAGYTFGINDKITANASAFYINYGKFVRTDEFGNEIGQFLANDLTINFSVGYEIDSLWSIGGTARMINSVYDIYNSFGVAADVAATYYKPSKNFTASFVLRNIGMPIKNYVSGQKEKLPFEIQAGVSKKLEHAPFRFSLIGENLHRWDLSVKDVNAKPRKDPLTGEFIEEKEAGFLQKTALHLVFNTELLISKNFHVRMGYNYRRRYEMKLDTRPGTVGLSWGFGFRINKFHLSYGRAAYHLTGGTNLITVSTRLTSFQKN